MTKEEQMHPLQAWVNAMDNATRRIRSEYHLTLGQMIDKLTELPSDLPVQFDWNGGSPYAADSYRGYYSDLAFDWRDDGPPTTIQEFLGACRLALGATFEGYKGGDFVMDDHTPLWAAQYSRCGRAIIGIDVTDGVAFILTKEAS